MNVKATLASQAYNQALAAAKPQSKPEGGAGDAFRAATSDFFETMREAETTVGAGLVGKADAHSVVEALAATELAVQTAVAVRDKVVEAYQEILRMPV